METVSEETEQVEITLGKIKTELLWWDWKERFMRRLNNKRGALRAPLHHVVREDKPAGWTIAQVTNDVERLIYSVSHTGPEFTIDNATVWSEIQNVAIDSPVYSWIRDYDKTRDGRGSFKALTEMCEGKASTNKRLLLASRIIFLN